jgi:hypothetical protein
MPESRVGQPPELDGVVVWPHDEGVKCPPVQLAAFKQKGIAPGKRLNLNSFVWCGGDLCDQNLKL